MNKILTDILQIEHGFRHIYDGVEKILISYPKEKCFNIAFELYKNEAYQARMLATLLLANLANENIEAYQFLKERVSLDSNWRVQEMLAKAFDLICKIKGYKNSLYLINEWVTNKNPNLVRAVIEGLRIWTSRPFFKENPLLAIEIISRHKSHCSEYVRKSVGNALKDISRKHNKLIIAELNNWDISNPLIKFTYKYATKHLKN